MSDLLDIGEVAARTGMAASTLRYYEREGILVSAERKGLRRQYQPNVLDTLAVVALCQRAGFSLAEIKALMATGGEQSWKTIAVRKRDELRSQIRHLEMLADHLDHALGCPSPNVFDCEHFQSALRQALPSGDPASPKVVRQRRRQATLPAIALPPDPDVSRTPSRPGDRR